MTNIYRVLLTRGICGTYVYVCDPGLRDYLREFIPSD
ncbi:MAG: DNA/RNA helicase domain-containing protein [Terrimesophilobacter sp.]